MLMLKGHERTSAIQEYIEKHGYFPASDLKKLIDKGYLEDFNSPKVAQTVTTENGKLITMKNTTIIGLYMVTPKFKEGIYIDDDDAAKEAWAAYPKVMMIDGKITATLNIEYDTFVEKYGNIINGNGILHKKIVEMFSKYKKLLKDGKANGMGLKKAIETKYWETIEVMVEMEEEEKFGKEK